MITDLQQRITAVNRAFTTITGYSEAEALGQSPRLLASGNHDSAFYAAMWHNLSASGPLARRDLEQTQEWRAVPRMADHQRGA